MKNITHNRRIGGSIGTPLGSQKVLHGPVEPHGFYRVPPGPGFKNQSLVVDSKLGRDEAAFQRSNLNRPVCWRQGKAGSWLLIDVGCL